MGSCWLVFLGGRGDEEGVGKGKGKKLRCTLVRN